LFADDFQGGGYDQVEVAFHEFGEVEDIDTEAVISHAVLGEIVSTDTFGAVAGSDL
jgi:hypothetical protein